MIGTKFKTMSTIARIIEKYQGNYCTASQEKLCELLGKYQGADIGTRTLRYHLRNLRATGLIKSIRRTHRNPNGTLCLRTSAICITCWGYEQLYKITRYQYFKIMADKLKKKYYPKLVKIFNKKPLPDAKDLMELRRRSKEKIKEILAQMK